MSLASLDTVHPGRSLARVPAGLWIGAGTALLVLALGTKLLRDTDTYWQIKVGQWILANHALPRVDMFSLTKIGEPWMSSSWLAQVLFAQVYALAGWGGVVMLTALAVGATFGSLAAWLSRRLTPQVATIIALAAFTLSAHHLLARPHVLAMPLLVLWVGGLVAAADARRAPSLALLPLLALWANIHGGFVLGLALVGPIGFDALVQAERADRARLVRGWLAFGIGAVLACGATPYGFGALLAARKILDLGQLLTLISEWAPANFASFSMFEGALLGLVGAALLAGVRLPPTRILLVLGLTHMALNHVRNIEVMALLLPLVLAQPLARQFAALAAPAAPRPWPAAASAALALAGALAMLLSAALPVRPGDDDAYAAAVAALRQHGAVRVFNDYGFGGYMIWAGLPPFIDGRAELYGEAFAMDQLNAISLADPALLGQLFARYEIDATLMYPTTPAARLLDHVEGWRKVYASDMAVVHVRTTPAPPPLRLKGLDGM
jgi:hypothetical protein